MVCGEKVKELLCRPIIVDIVCVVRTEVVWIMALVVVVAAMTAVVAVLSARGSVCGSPPCRVNVLPRRGWAGEVGEWILGVG